MNESPASCVSDDDAAAYAQGVLESADQARVAAHLDTCDDCRELIATLARMFTPEEGAKTLASDKPVLAGRYRLVRSLGSGPRGEVHEAEDIHLAGERVAIKRLKGKSLSDPTIQRRIRRVIAAQRGMRHRHVCAAYDLIEEGAMFLVAMPLVRGDDLATVIAREPMDEASAHQVLQSVTEALCAGHKANLCHGAVNMANVLIDLSGHAMVTDFGLAAAFDKAVDLSSLDPSKDIADLVQLARELMSHGVGQTRGTIVNKTLDLIEVFAALPKPRLTALRDGLRRIGDRDAILVSETLHDVPETIGERYTVLGEVGRGGMGVVYRARDQDGKIVAIKVIHAERVGAARHEERFAREVRALAELSHPAIVRYLEHGEAPGLGQYLVMEWVDGESLAELLERQRFDVVQSVKLMRTVAEAVGEAHQKGMVHRDLKPANIMIPGGRHDRVKVLDFGLARFSASDGSLTQTGMLVGTPGYLSPEQARGLRDVDARSDVFSMGVILYECLTGIAPFEGRDALSICAKTILAAAPDVRNLLPDAPQALLDLLDAMLEKELRKRPADGTAVASALAEVVRDNFGTMTMRTVTQRLTRAERALLTVVVVALGQTGDADVRTESVMDLARRFGATAVRLNDGSVVLAWRGPTMSPSGDQPTRIARCALRLRHALPDVPLGVATGYAIVDRGAVGGEVIDNASALLGVGDGVAIDEVSARLTEARFDVVQDGGHFRLVAEREHVARPRLLLGRATPLVGRASELETFRDLARATFAEPRAQALMLTGDAGVGKSRLRYEMVEGLRKAFRGLTVFQGQADPSRAGSPFGLIGAALRVASRVRDGAEISEQEQRMIAFVERYDVRDPFRVASFIGEAIGIPFDDDSDVQLRAARGDAALMNDQIQLAWQELVFAVCQRGPLLIVLEDVHWGDMASVKLIDTALRNMADRPLFVLALARPGVHERFPRLWSERHMQELKLPPLEGGASAELVRQVLGSEVDESRVAAIVDQAGGNAFYLEELIRSEAQIRAGNQHDLTSGESEVPGSVLAVVRRRLERMEPDARDILRAASVFGRTFWAGGVQKLLGERARTATLSQWLDTLARREVVVPAAASAFKDATELIFRHGLLRSAAYGMLTDRDRVVGHGVAAEWLEEAGSRDAVMLAEHYERGERPADAARWWKRAAEIALAGNSLDAAIEHAERAVAGGSSAADEGALCLLMADAFHWSGDHARALGAAHRATEIFELGSDAWCDGTQALSESYQILGDGDGVARMARSLISCPASGRVTVARSRCLIDLRRVGRVEEAEMMSQALMEEEVTLEDDDPRARAFVHRFLAMESFYAQDVGAQLRHLLEAIALFEASGDVRWAARERCNLGISHAYVGDYLGAEKLLLSAVETVKRLGLDYFVCVAEQNLGLVIGRLGQVEQARQLELRAADVFAGRGAKRMEGFCQLYLAQIALWSADAVEAEARARQARTLFEVAAPTLAAYAIAAVARACLIRDDFERAHALIREAVETMQTRGIDEGEIFVRLTLAETLAAVGHMDEAEAALLETRDRIRERAGKLAPEHRRTFLANVSENRRTLELIG